ncbi:unnamed protein product [Adineta steineri]|uniref:Uncharacterized protein n=1 Tax=Adineta steineri TaxID=433720 RepID=A0A814WIG1_9BILA|nr:unnamed protein product [Adineta steineri]CAF3606194.1 unnamed protein product [Adineta steineri]
MRIRAVLVLTFALFFAISALIFHFLAMFSKRWVVAVPRKPRGPNDQIHYYGLWTRCQYSNTSFVIPDISSQPNIENFVCRPNTYLRYDSSNQDITKKCYESRHQCSSIIGVHLDCRCEYLSITKIQQCCTILAAICLLIAIFVFYLKIIASPQNAIAARILIFTPMILLSLALVLMFTTIILLGAYLRRNEYEDYDIKLPKEILHRLPMQPESFNLYRLKTFLKTQEDLSLRRQAISVFKSIHKERFYARIDWSAGAEIIAIILTFITHILSVFLALKQVQ